MLQTFQRGASVHSSGELGMQLATMLHLGAALPSLGFAADARYRPLPDDVVKGGKMQCAMVRSPLPSGLARRRARPRQARGNMRALGGIDGYAYDRDPSRPDWTR